MSRVVASRALATLWLKSGEARDLIDSIKREPSDRRNNDVAAVEAIVNRLEEQLLARDLAAAVVIADRLERACFKLRAAEAGPFVQSGRKQHASLKSRREAHNRSLQRQRASEWARWNKAADEYWSKHPEASKNSVARWVKERLGLSEASDSIARRLKKTRQTS
jgi:hypothetical protein